MTDHLIDDIAPRWGYGGCDDPDPVADRRRDRADARGRRGSVLTRAGVVTEVTVTPPAGLPFSQAFARNREACQWAELYVGQPGYQVHTRQFLDRRRIPTICGQPACPHCCWDAA